MNQEPRDIERPLPRSIFDASTDCSGAESRQPLSAVAVIQRPAVACWEGWRTA